MTSRHKWSGSSLILSAGGQLPIIPILLGLFRLATHVGDDFPRGYERVNNATMSEFGGKSKLSTVNWDENNNNAWDMYLGLISATMYI